MGRKALGCEPVFEALKTLTKGELNKELKSPVGHLAMSLGWAYATIVKYLRFLYTHEVIEIVHGTKRSILAVKLLKAELPGELCDGAAAPKPRAPKPAPEVKVAVVLVAPPLPELKVKQAHDDWAEEDEPGFLELPSAEKRGSSNGAVVAPSPAPASPAVQQPEHHIVVVLVDYENALYSARDAGYKLSFEKLMTRACAVGHVIWAEVFIPPHVAQDQRVVRELWSAGFRVVCCPMGSKDKDAVDKKLETHVWTLVYATRVTDVLLVSEDSDFNDCYVLGKKLGVAVTRFAVSDKRDALAGDETEERLAMLGERPQQRLFERAARIFHGDITAGNPEETNRVAFLRAVSTEIGQLKSQNSGRKYSFNALCDEAWFRLKTQWLKYGYDAGMVKEAVLALNKYKEQQSTQALQHQH